MARPVRYTFILALFALGTTLAAVGGWRYARASAPVPGPIILISIDALRADHLPAYGYTRVNTPTIDALARDGVVFERAYSHAPQTLPAHVAMLSGRLPFETGVRDDAAFGAPRRGERLLARMLRDRGYTTGGVVSSDLLRRETGLADGFDFFDDEMPAVSAESIVGELQRDGADSEVVAEQWLGTVGSARAFLFLHLAEPQRPYDPPARFGEWEPYDGEIAYADEIVGRLVRYLKTHQLYDQSTIVLVSDHGEGLGEHGEQEHGLFVYEEAVHVPLIIKQAGGVGAGRRVSNLVQHIDLAPTILDLVKAPVPGTLRGRSLKSMADGTGRLSSRAVYSEAPYGRHHFGWSDLASVTDGRYRYVRAPREELYDLQHDPHEADNLLGADLAEVGSPATTEALQKLRTALEDLVGAAPTTEEIGADPKDKPEVVERYRRAIALTVERKWGQAIAVLQQILHDEPQAADAWTRLGLVATRAERYDLAVSAFEHAIEIRPLDADALVGAATASLRARKLAEAQEFAERASVVGAKDARLVAQSHVLLANVALARNDAEAARQEAALAQKADPALPVTPYVDARLRYDAGEYPEALPLFQQANAELLKTRGVVIRDLHYFTGETLVRLERYADAEAQFVQELREFPHNVRARAALATLYHSRDRSEDAARVASDLVRITPTPDSYAQAARLWTTLGNRRQAESVRAEARRTFAAKRR